MLEKNVNYTKTMLWTVVNGEVIGQLAEMPTHGMPRLVSSQNGQVAD